MIPGGTDMFYKIISTEHLSDDIISMWIEAPDIAKKAGAGQFISIYSDSKSELLPRPISICDTDGENALRIVFRIVGKGTKEFAEKKAGDVLRIIGPLIQRVLPYPFSDRLETDTRILQQIMKTIPKRQRLLSAGELEYRQCFFYLKL